jgi:uncharacterized membrane protein YphA (DoxX/SURF4 family)
MEVPAIVVSAYAARFFLAIVLIVAGASKLFQVKEFERAVASYQLLPRGFSRPVATWLPRVELGAGLMLALGVVLVPIAYLTALLLAVFSAAVSINLVRGKEMSCNCFGASTPEKMTWLSVVRNLLLMCMAFSVALVPPVALSVWPTMGGVSTATAITLGAVLAMLVTATSAVLVAGLVSQGLRVANSIRVLRRHLSVEGREQA